MIVVDIIDNIESSRNITLQQLRELLTTNDDELLRCLFNRASLTAQSVYGKKIFMRGLIEISNHCKNDCLYCGIRCSKTSVQRYRLSAETILDCCREGYGLGFRTFVLQGGEDPWFTDEKLVALVGQIRTEFPDCAITLSLGERSRASYQALYDAGANRYLLRHETASPEHYARLHPHSMSFLNRMQCLNDLKEIGYQVGCGFMVGSPFQTVETLYADLQFLRTFQPHMVGIGPFIPAQGTPFEGEKAGSVDITVRLLAIIRLLLPKVLLPATTALGTLHPQGREMGIAAGANVIMPNLSPTDNRKNYSIYDNKLATGSEAAECVEQIRQSLSKIDATPAVDRGDYPSQQ